MWQRVPHSLISTGQRYLCTETTIPPMKSLILKEPEVARFPA